MKKLGQTAEAVQRNLRTPSTKSRQKTSPKTGIPISWVSAIFKKFQLRYGYKWTGPIEGIESEAVAEWHRGLQGLTSDQIKRGVDSWPGDWPPSRDEFRKACIGNDDEFGIGYVPEYHRQRPERKRSRLLSSDDRDNQRNKLSANLKKLKEKISHHRAAAAPNNKANPFVSDQAKRNEISAEIKLMGIKI